MSPIGEILDDVGLAGPNGARQDESADQAQKNGTMSVPTQADLPIRFIWQIRILNSSLLMVCVQKPLKA